MNERRTITPPPHDDDGSLFLRSLLGQQHADEHDEHEHHETTPARIPAGVRDVPPTPVRVDDWLRAMAYSAVTGDHDPLHRVESGWRPIT